MTGLWIVARVLRKIITCILNMAVRMSMTNDDYDAYLCDPSSVEVDTVLGEG
jgi:hypothetical protein